MSLDGTNWSRFFGNPCRATDYFIENCCADCYCCSIPSHVCNFNFDEGEQRKRIYAWLMQTEEKKVDA